MTLRQVVLRGMIVGGLTGYMFCNGAVDAETLSIRSGPSSSPTQANQGVKVGNAGVAQSSQQPVAPRVSSKELEEVSGSERHKELLEMYQADMEEEYAKLSVETIRSRFEDYVKSSMDRLPEGPDKKSQLEALAALRDRSDAEKKRLLINVDAFMHADRNIKFVQRVMIGMEKIGQLVDQQRAGSLSFMGLYAGVYIVKDGVEKCPEWECFTKTLDTAQRRAIEVTEEENSRHVAP